MKISVSGHLVEDLAMKPEVIAAAGLELTDRQFLVGKHALQFEVAQGSVSGLLVDGVLFQKIERPDQDD